MEIIEDMCGINKFIVEGMIQTARNDTKGTKEALVELFKLKNDNFQIEESIGRAFASMAIGSVNNIEDLADHLNYDQDAAEVLVQLSASPDINFNYLTHNSVFVKFFFKLGVDSHKVAAIIGLAKNDISAAQ